MIYGYTRVSTNEQATEGQSLESQERMIQGYAQMKWAKVDEPVIHFFSDAGVSGSVPLSERPDGQALLEKVATGDHIIVSKLDRMFRSSVDALNTLEVLKNRGVSLHMIDLGGDVCGNGISKLVFTILSAVAESERVRISERIKDAMANKRANGEYLGGRKPFGYEVVDGKLVENDHEQALIRGMINLHMQGDSYRDIADYAKRHGCEMPPMSVYRIIHRELDKDDG